MGDARPDRRRYTYQIRCTGDGCRWEILDMGDKGYCGHDDPVVWSMPHLESHWALGEPPKEFRDKYEALLRDSGWQPWAQEDMPNLVEMMASEDDDCAWDQPCAFGYRVESHAVYCHNDAWLYAPRKCHRSQHEADWRHEDCPGFKPNPLTVKP